MTVTINAQPVALGTSSAPLIEGAASTTYGAEGGGVGFSNSAPFTGRRGCRVALAAVTDFTTHTHVGFGFHTTSYWLAPSLASVAAGGLRVVFVDASGNYSGFSVYGSGIPDFKDSNAGRTDGFMSSYSNVSSGSDRPISWQIDRLAQPAISAGVINWAQIVAVEVTVSVSSPVSVNLYIGELRKLSDIVATGAVTPESILGEVTDAGSTLGDMQHWVSSPFILQTAPVRIISAKMGWRVGDGTTPTHFTAVAVALGFFNTFDTSPTHRSVGPLLLLAGNKARKLLVNQSASDTLSMTDCSVSSAAWWQWELSGSGVATCARVQFWRFNGFRAAHGHYVDCAWNDADSAVEVTAATVISGGLIRGAKATGLKVLGAAGVYSNLDLSIDSLVGAYDIELGEGGAGTYELPNITVPAGRTLRVRNNSASNAVVVILPDGTVYSATTAGGSITVVSAGTKLTITDLPLGCDAVVLTAGTSTVLAQADELSGATFVFEYTGAPVVDIGIFKPGYKPRYLRNLQLAATNAAIPVSLEIDRSYLP